MWTRTTRETARFTSSRSSTRCKTCATATPRHACRLNGPGCPERSRTRSMTSPPTTNEWHESWRAFGRSRAKRAGSPAGHSSVRSAASGARLSNRSTNSSRTWFIHHRDGAGDRCRCPRLPGQGREHRSDSGSHPQGGGRQRCTLTINLFIQSNGAPAPNPVHLPATCGRPVRFHAMLLAQDHASA